MKTYLLKIRDKFISEIRAGTKRHEYRLATPDRMEIKIGDSLVLISNQDRQNYIKTTVDSIKNYKGWKEALEDNWHDFKDVYDSEESALKECYKFYTKSQVDTYGIIVFAISPIKIDYSNTSILLDTNIVIKRESGNNVSYEIASLFNWFKKKSVSTFIHSSTKAELLGYDDKSAKDAMLTKLNSYEVLPSLCPIQDDYFDNVMSRFSQDKNGKIDNQLLKEIYDDNVGILLTDDKLILKKAKDLFIRDRVLSSAELLSYYESTYPKNIEYKMLAVKLKEFGEVNLESNFFDSLREDYGGSSFDRWFKNKALKKEQAYVFEDATGLKGFLYLKYEDENENYSDITPILPPKKRLKVGTLKIERTGFRLGERFLKIIFDNARKYNVDEIYVTLYEEKRDGVKQLKSMMEEWGFQKWGQKNDGEAVLIKTLERYNEKQKPKFNYPLINPTAKYFFLPIFPQYHTDLFPDMILKNEAMHLYEENKAHRYALEKIYLSGAYNIQAKAGDLILIYRAGERKPKRFSSAVTGVAILEDINHTKTIDECIEQCKNRSIFSEDEIKSLHDKYPIIVKLLDYTAFKNKVSLNELYQKRIVQEGYGPRPFERLSQEQYDMIYKLGMEED